MLRRDDVVLKGLKGVIVDLPSSMKLKYLWKFGSMLGFILVMQLISGMFLSFIYSSDTMSAFSSVDLMNREIWGGWVARGVHMAGSSSFFLFMYLHMGRNLYYLTYINNLTVWLSGVAIYILAMAVGFLGYVLPWGQMSYWGATVMTNFVSVMPIYGVNLVVWMWGGFAVDYPTLSRFFGLHFLLPFILVVLVMFHMIFLHERGSSNPLGFLKTSDLLAFHPYFSMKDAFGMSITLFIVYFSFFYNPDFMLETENNIEANPLVTPAHIQPEWYYLAAYAILRAMPKKLGGVLALVGFMMMLGIYPFLQMNPNLATMGNKVASQALFWVFCSNFLLLTWVGGCPVEDPYVFMSRVSGMLYFLYFFLGGFISFNSMNNEN